MSTDAVLDSLLRFEWVADRILALNDIAPRHIGRVVTFNYAETPDPNNYQTYRVIGVLEGAIGVNLVVAGDEFLWTQIDNLKVWRSGVKK